MVCVLVSLRVGLGGTHRGVGGVSVLTNNEYDGEYQYLVVVVIVGFRKCARLCGRCDDRRVLLGTLPGSAPLSRRGAYAVYPHAIPSTVPTIPSAPGRTTTNVPVSVLSTDPRGDSSRCRPNDRHGIVHLKWWCCFFSSKTRELLNLQFREIFLCCHYYECLSSLLLRCCCCCDY